MLPNTTHDTTYTGCYDVDGNESCGTYKPPDELQQPCEAWRSHLVWQLKQNGDECDQAAEFEAATAADTVT
jgi:hypothetical protein